MERPLAVYSKKIWLLTLFSISVLHFPYATLTVTDGSQTLKTLYVLAAALDNGFHKLAASVIEMNPYIITLQDEDGLTAAHYVARTGNMDLLNLLMCFNAPFDLPDKADKMPFDYAHAEGQWAIKTYLMYVHRNYGLLPPPVVPLHDVIDKDGNTELHWAAQVADVQRVKDLLCSREVNIRNNMGQTPLHCLVLERPLAPSRNRIVAGSYFKTMKMLCKAGADVNAPDFNNNTPLHYLGGLIGISRITPFEIKRAVSSLLFSGARIELLNFDKKTAGDIAEENIRRMAHSDVDWQDARNLWHELAAGRHQCRHEKQWGDNFKAGAKERSLVKKLSPRTISHVIDQHIAQRAWE